MDVKFTLEERGKKQDHNLNGTLFFESGGAWRFKGFDLLGRTAVDLLITKEGFQIYLPAQNEFLSGTLDQLQELQLGTAVVLPNHLLTAVNALEPLSLDPLEIPMLEEKAEASVLNLFYLQGPRGILNRRAYFKGKDLDLTRQELFDAEGQVEMTVDYQDYQNLGGLRLPFRVSAKNRNSKAMLHFKEIKTNPGFGPRDFEIRRAMGEIHP